MLLIVSEELNWYLINIDIIFDSHHVQFHSTISNTHMLIVFDSILYFDESFWMIDLNCSSEPFSQ